MDQTFFYPSLHVTKIRTNFIKFVVNFFYASLFAMDPGVEVNGYLDVLYGIVV
jgi:hypothetical protein